MSDLLLDKELVKETLKSPVFDEYPKEKTEQGIRRIIPYSLFRVHYEEAASKQQGANVK